MKIFYTTDDFNRVIPRADFSEDIEPPEDWLTGNITGSAYESHGIPLWKREKNKVVKRTDEEVQADIDAMDVPEPTETEQLRADVDYLLMLIEEE